MGTRAAFFIGDPQDLENREWLGCIAWDGYPDGVCNRLADASSAQHFRALVEEMALDRDDFADPAKGGWPFPWENDLFVTDCTYWFAEGDTHFAWLHRRCGKLADYLEMSDEEAEEHNNQPDDLPSNVQTPSGWDRTQPDSIMIIRAKS